MEYKKIDEETIESTTKTLIKKDDLLGRKTIFVAEKERIENEINKIDELLELYNEKA